MEREVLHGRYIKTKNGRDYVYTIISFPKKVKKNIMSKVWLVKSNGQGLDFGSDTHQTTFKQDLKENLGKVYRIEQSYT